MLGDRDAGRSEPRVEFPKGVPPRPLSRVSLYLGYKVDTVLSMVIMGGAFGNSLGIVE